MPAPTRCNLILMLLCLLVFVFSLDQTSQAQQPPKPRAAGDVALPQKASESPREKSPEHAETPESLVQLNSALEALASRVSQGVVQILVSGYGPVEESGRADTALIARQRAIGSGVIVDPSGYVMTNAHVIEGAQRIRVVLPVPASESAILEPEGKRRILTAKLIGVHQESDLALLKVDAQNLPTLPLGNSRRIHQGQLVFAIGSPEGLQGTVTMGIVSFRGAPGRSQ